MVLLDNDEFIARLKTLTSAARNEAAFTITMKRYDGRTRPVPREGRPPLPEPAQYMCLIRAQSRSAKLSTVVEAAGVARVMEQYGRIMKSSMDGLKKVKKTKSKAKATA